MKSRISDLGVLLEVLMRKNCLTRQEYSWPDANLSLLHKDVVIVLIDLYLKWSNRA